MSNLTRLVKNAVLLRSLDWAKAVHHLPFRFSRANARDLSKGLYVPEAEAFVTGKTAEDLVIFQDLGSIKRVHEDLGAEFEFRDGRWLAKFQGMTFVLRSKLDPFLLCEVFLERTYDVHTAKAPTIALDIGMNVGIASLYLAKELGCEVHAFELCPPTFETAKENLALNPMLAAKVHGYCFGLADRDDHMEISYQDANTAVSSIYDLYSVSNSPKIPVEIKRASEVLAPILVNTEIGGAFAKIDCEGAEFPILRDLDEAGLLSKFGAIVMEWHSTAGDPQELSDILSRNGFEVSNREWVDDLGFMTAIRPG